jgi:hypothetical protein
MHSAWSSGLLGDWGLELAADPFVDPGGIALGHCNVDESFDAVRGAGVNVQFACHPGLVESGCVVDGLVAEAADVSHAHIRRWETLEPTTGPAQVIYACWPNSTVRRVKRWLNRRSSVPRRFP